MKQKGVCVCMHVYGVRARVSVVCMCECVCVLQSTKVLQTLIPALWFEQLGPEDPAIACSILN